MSEKVEEVLKAIEYPGVASVQIIFNMFRLKPAEEFFKEAMAKLALRWILMFDEVSSIIPGASITEQVLLNISASQLPSLTDEEMNNIKEIYDKYIKSSVHPLW